MAHKVGRPPKFTEPVIAEIVKDLEYYIERTADPTIVGFTSNYSKYMVHKEYIYDRTEFSQLVKKAIEKQESFLLYGATNNRLNASVSIFRLKQPQHGYKDRTETDITSKDEKIDFTPKEHLSKQFDDFLKKKDKA